MNCLGARDRRPRGAAATGPVKSWASSTRTAGIAALRLAEHLLASFGHLKLVDWPGCGDSVRYLWQTWPDLAALGLGEACPPRSGRRQVRYAGWRRRSWAINDLASTRSS